MKKKKKTVFSYIKKYKILLIIVPILTVFESAISLYLPLALSKLVEEGINLKNIETIKYYGIIIFTVALVSFIVNLLTTYLSNIVENEFSATLKKGIFKRVSKTNLSKLEIYEPSTVLTRIMNDSSKVSMALGMGLSIALKSPLTLIGTLIAIFTINIYVGIGMIILIPILIGIGIIFGKIIVPISKKTQEILDRINKIVGENVKGIRVVKSYTLEKNEYGKFKEKNKDYRNIVLKYVFTLNTIIPIITLVISLVFIGVLYYGRIFSIYRKYETTVIY